MTTTQLITFLGYLAGALTTISFIPQVLQTIKTRNTKGISLPMYMILIGGIFLWVVYGFAIHQSPIWIPNLIVLILSSIILIMKLRYG